MQTELVDVERLTGKAEVDDAVSRIGAEPNGRLPGGPNVIVWGTPVSWALCVIPRGTSPPFESPKNSSLNRGAPSGLAETDTVMAVPEVPGLKGVVVDWLTTGAGSLTAVPGMVKVVVPK